MTLRVVVIHYDAADGEALAGRIRREGFEASVYPHRGPTGFRTLRESPPDAIVIDLMRLPSYGRVMGALLREQKSTRSIPLVFVKGDPEKARQARELLPDAVFADLLQIGAAIRRAIARPPKNPLAPDASRIPLVKKLKIQSGSVFSIRYAPIGFVPSLGPLPEGARLAEAGEEADVVLIFVKTPAALSRELALLARESSKGRTFWIAWPKQKAKTASLLTMPGIREMCLQVGWIGYKVCAIDETWSAIAIAPRRK